MGPDKVGGCLEKNKKAKRRGWRARRTTSGRGGGGAPAGEFVFDFVDLVLGEQVAADEIQGEKRADGKWVKPPDYSPARLQPILAAQGSLES